MPRGQKLSLTDFQDKYQAPIAEEAPTNTSELVGQRRITTEQVENIRGGGYRDYGAPGGDRYERRGGYGERERREPREPLPVPDEPPYRAFVRNIPRECTEDDVASFFEGHQIEDLSMPRGMDGNPKGFCFITFGTRDELKYLVEELGRMDIGGGHEISIEVAGGRRNDRGGSRYGSSRYGGPSSDMGEGPRFSEADDASNWRRSKPTGPSRRGRRAPPRSSAPGGSGGGRFGGLGGGRMGGSPRGGGRFGGSGRGGRFGDSAPAPAPSKEIEGAIYLNSSNPFGESKPVVPKDQKKESSE